MIDYLALVIAVYLILTLLCLVFLKPRNPLFEYSRRVWIWIDQGVNVVFLWGNEDHTISGRAGFSRQRDSPLWTKAANLIDKLFKDPNHCTQAIERQAAEREVRETPAIHLVLIYGGSGLVSVLTIAGLIYVFT